MCPMGFFWLFTQVLTMAAACLSPTLLFLLHELTSSTLTLTLFYVIHQLGASKHIPLIHRLPDPIYPCRRIELRWYFR